MATTMPSMARQLRRRAGIPKKKSSASTVPEPAPSQPLPLPKAGTTRPAVAAVLLTVAVAVPGLVVPKFSDAPLVMEQEGVSPDWLVGPPELSEQLSATVPP